MTIFVKYNDLEEDIQNYLLIKNQQKSYLLEVVYIKILAFQFFIREMDKA
jgi:hypothetical protein